ncbi:MAG: hypothetical protein AAGM22_27115, partial [Acidobacteriota bacterium]
NRPLTAVKKDVLMVLKIRTTWLELCIPCLLALPTSAQEVESPRMVSFSAVVELVVVHIQELVADFGFSSEAHGTLTDVNSATMTESDTGTATEDDDGLPNFGPGLEPHG